MSKMQRDMLKLHEDLKKIKNNRVPYEELRFLIEDTQKFMREDTEDLEKTESCTHETLLSRFFYQNVERNRFQRK